MFFFFFFCIQLKVVRLVLLGVEYLVNDEAFLGAVLVHCLAGVSRSASIVVAYLLTVTNLNYSLALTYLTSRRPCANPNFGFRMQLYRFSTDV